MARPNIVWRNPKPVKRVRTWTHVRRDEQRTLYLVLESNACGKASWEGLPTLEILRTARTSWSTDRRSRRTQVRTGA